ncbi:MAG: response regulator [Candidatus Poribacteria bacterium]
MGIRYKLIITLILTGVFPLLTAIFITHYIGISQRKEIVGNTFQQLSEKACDSIRIMITEDIKSIKELSVLPITIKSLESEPLKSTKVDMSEIQKIEKQWGTLTEKDELLRKLLENELSMTLKAFKSVEGSFGEILVTEKTGKLISATNKTSDYWQADEDWWQETYNNGKGKLFLSKFGYDESAKVFAMDLCVPVFHKDKIVGIMKGVLDVSHLFDAIENINIGEGGKVALLSDNGEMFASRYMLSISNGTEKYLIPSQKLGNSGWFVASDDGKSEMMVGFAKISIITPDIQIKLPWSVIAYQPSKIAYAPVLKMIWFVTLPGIGLIAVFYLLGLYIAKKVFISPLNQLIYMTKRLSDSDLEQEVMIKSKDEIGELARAFNQMASNLAKRSSLDNVALNMLSNLKLSDVLNIVVEALRTTFDAAFARVWLIDNGDLCPDCIHADICTNKDKCLHLMVTVGTYARDEDYMRVPIGTMRVGRIAESRTPSLVNDLAKDNYIHNPEWMKRSGIVAFAGYPLILGDELLGVIALFSKRLISDEEFKMLGSFANRTAMAIQNAKLHLEILELNQNLERKVLERTRELEIANVKLKKADRMKSEFLANMSHELRTPLNAVIGFAEVLRDGLCGELNENQKSAVIDIYESGKHLLQMINDILDLSKVEAGKMELQLEEFSLREAIDETQSIIRDMANRKGLGLQVFVSDRVSNIYADQVKFKQIMYNLLSNAIKFTMQGSITISADCDDEKYVISVQDTGIGIEPKNFDVIFDEFKQLDSSQSRQYEGTGLGLALTKRLVELHGGKIWIESEGLGHGSKFSFTIPKIKQEQKLLIESHQHEPIQISMGKLNKGKKILIVEDNEHAAQLLRIYLTDAGYETEVAVDGEEAIKKAKQILPFAITLDIMLPKKDGWQVMQELKDFPDTSHIPIIIISIVDDESLGFSLGAVGYLVKPLDKDQLIGILDKIELASKQQNPKVLIIDDNEDDVRLMESILINEDFNVLKAYNGNDGIELTIKEKPDLIILDLMMPEKNGFDVVKTIWENPEIKDIPIIISTMKEITQEDREHLNSKVKSIIQKGEDAKERILQAIRNIEKFKK